VTGSKRKFLAKKAIYFSVTLFAILTTNFLMFRVMPGDPAVAFLPRGASPEVLEMVREDFHLNDPLIVQYYDYIVDTLTLDFSVTTVYPPSGTEVLDIVSSRLFNTLLLIGVGLFVAIFAGISLGRYAAWRRGEAADTVVLTFTLVFYTMPTFVLALALLILFCGALDWFPLQGAYGELPFVENPPPYSDMNLLEKIVSRSYHFAMPMLAFSLQMMADFMLIMRNSLTDVLTEDYIITAKAKGLSDRHIMRDHAMRNAMLPVVTVIALSMGWIVGGEIMVELIFSYEGIGQLTWEAVEARDYPLLQALFLILAVGVLVANMISDIVYMYIDPRVKL
jgi:peptide/nickel transport system permease protein